MPEEQGFIDYPQLLKALKQLSQEKRTGTVFITTENNHAVRFSLQQGIITSCYYGLRKGYDAIVLIKTITKCKFKFASGIFTDQESGFPETEDVFNMLNPNTDYTIIKNNNVNKKPKEIETLLASYIGPFSSMICAETDTKDMEVFINTVAQEIDEISQQQEFKQKALKILKS